MNLDAMKQKKNQQEKKKKQVYNNSNNKSKNICAHAHTKVHTILYEKIYWHQLTNHCMCDVNVLDAACNNTNYMFGFLWKWFIKWCKMTSK